MIDLFLEKKEKNNSKCAKFTIKNLNQTDQIRD